MPAFAIPAPSIKIPENIGRIDAAYFGNAGAKTVIYIEDAHDSIEAQQNIAALIHNLVKTQNVKRVYEEGYEGIVPTGSLFKKPVKQEIFNLMDRLKVGGAEYAHLYRRQDFQLIGAENLELYLRNVNQYAQAAKAKTALLAEISKIESKFQAIIHEQFSEKTADFLGLKKKFLFGNLSIVEYAVQLYREAGAPKLNRSYRALEFIATVQKQENPSFDFTLELKDLERELSSLETELLEENVPAAGHREVIQALFHIWNLRKLAGLEISSAEFKEIAGRRMNSNGIVSLMKEYVKRPALFSRKWETYLRHAEKFYETASKRDAAVEASLRKFKLTGENTAVLVFGGFHRAGIEKILNRQKLNYVVVRPHISRQDETHQKLYRRLMSQGYTENGEGSFANAARYPSVFVDRYLYARRAAFRSELRMDFTPLPEATRAAVKKHFQAGLSLEDGPDLAAVRFAQMEKNDEKLFFTSEVFRLLNGPPDSVNFHELPNSLGESPELISLDTAGIIDIKLVYDPQSRSFNAAHIEAGGSGQNVAGILSRLHHGSKTHFVTYLHPLESSDYQAALSEKINAPYSIHAFKGNGKKSVYLRIPEGNHYREIDLKPPTPALTDEQIMELLKYADEMPDARGLQHVMFGGSLFNGNEQAYQALLQSLKRKGYHVLADFKPYMSTAEIRAILKAGPHIVKPNLEEFSRAVDLPADRLKQNPIETANFAKQAAIQYGIPVFIVSLDEAGAVMAYRRK